MGKHVGCDAISELATWLKCQRLLGKHRHHLRQASATISHNIVLMIERRDMAAGNEFVGKPCSMCEQVFNRNRALCRLKATAWVKHHHAGKSRIKLRKKIK